ncbi:MULTISPECIES: DUF6401 family natural product biosynthesis protein [unclassified Solwaraspora]|uniref:DUF6401 family natural product biosynthesis protein n=1 Tax=unclassified Solwaraspora TaxID=2627926 RepID=UPI00259B5E73|nr:DUF6401 family natural product biosynthesis protein [Solwaraspora sp. WMMA2056]WJK39413.1 DUF6401 family natural product biosynthesis protein [Solwaraspora sp. WMMA2056]
MTTPYGSPVPSLRAAPAARRSARSTLQDLHAALGDHGLRAAAGSPGLLAELDQHGAGVRDRLWADLRPLHPVTLARYAQGVRDAAVESGWHPPVGPTTDWSRADWVTLRLVAVCQLAASCHR